ncbi:Conserved secreted protein [Caenorhabditis elegans]|uniref:Conserved secreted protein n=1 Tax=Caenorhabditis elegans TaxID=6239 RepID=Q9XWS6_CAEEL|nr:Conserved secreted protein [Caenorhabditis elegans]CAA21569.2 Conserved secreted protein [Caenorhabditis elegans]|eukprot:NP_509986.2 Uncharacterized protein CELE_Y62H9A.5 [Caenorhabditis elegans]
MVFLILTVACIAMVAADGYGAASDPSYPAPGPSYGGGGYPIYSDEDSDSREHRRDFRKLKDLHKTNVVDARIRYYKHRGDYYAEISCPRQSDNKKYTWILADSDEKIPSFGIDGTVALAAGLNVRYVAKYSRHGKWSGRDMTNSDKQKFRRVGCHHGTFETSLTV